MKKILSMVVLWLLLIYPVIADAGYTEKSAQQFAAKYFEKIILDLINSEDPSNYNLTNSTNITFGKLYKRYRLSNDFVTTKKELSEEQGIVESSEYIAVVYQDNIPVNVIATAPTENGDYVLSMFGYGKDLAIALDAKSTDSGKIVYEAPADAWYLLKDGIVSAFAKSALLLIEEPLELSEFRKYIYEKYTSQKEIIEYGQNTAVGGNLNKTYEEVMQENESSSSTMEEKASSISILKLSLLIGSGILLISYFALRYYRKQQRY
ncbi:hypothetical protein [Bacillus ndiopicus]|uniref:hypothetical protein n=1 Tax=Bacillus ndiopicus TaxID=1347368 RepID=UPI0005A90D35|nr:hypothetical protein [Bacillus ndiopicus]